MILPLLFLAWIGREAGGQGQIFYGYYFGCRPDLTLCIQVQVLPAADFSTAMRIETFSDYFSVWSEAYKYDRMMHFFPSVKYRWSGSGTIELEYSSSGLEYSFKSGRSRLVKGPNQIQFSSLGGSKPLSLRFRSETQLQMLGVDLLYYRAPVDWLYIITFCRYVNGWNFSEENVKFLSFPLETTFERLVQLDSQRRPVPCCFGGF